MRGRALGAVLVVAAALLDGSAAASLRPRMLGGAADATHEAVVALVDGAGRTVCSGTLVAPRAVLTAAHCLPFDEKEPLPFARACIGASAARCVQTVAVTSSVRHPAYRPGAFHHDLAVVTLTDDARAAPAILAAEAPPLGSAMVLVGFGRTDASNPATIGERRARTVTVDSLADDRASYGESTCTGDSGGGGFVAGELVAVTSSGPAYCRDFGDSQLVATERAFIEREAGLAAESGSGCTMSPSHSPRASWPLLFVLCLFVARRSLTATLAARRAISPYATMGYARRLANTRLPSGSRSSPWCSRSAPSSGHARETPAPCP